MVTFSPPTGRMAGTARRGSLVVTAFMIVIGMAVMVGGIHAMLKNQLDQTLTIKDISLARTQAVYLAEMGVNQLMYDANKGATGNALTPWPMAIGSKATYDFKANVALVRNNASTAAKAYCDITRTATNSFRCDASLEVPGVGTFSKRVDFTAAYTLPVWKLTALQAY